MSSSLDHLSTQSISRESLSPVALEHELEALGDRWSVERGSLRLAIHGPMSRTGIAAAFAGTLADELDHHPRISIDRSGLQLAIRTPGASAITVLDLVFAARVELWLRGNGWPT